MAKGQQQPGDQVVAYTKRDVQVIIDQAQGCVKRMSDLQTMSIPQRDMAVAITEMETSILWMKKLQEHTPESY